MPLYSQNGQGGVNQSFDHAVGGTADRNQSFADLVYGLMMSGVYPGAVSVKLIEEVLTTQITVVDMVELVMSGPPVGFGGVNVLCDVAAEVDIDELKPFADAEHGLFLFHKTGEELELQDVELSVHIAGTVVRLSEEGGRNVAAAGEKQMGGVVCGFGVQEGVMGDGQPLQRFFIVFGILTAAGDDNGGKRRHRTYSFLQGALLYHMQGQKIGLKMF